MKHRLIHSAHVTPILASTNPRIGWAVIAGFVGAALIIVLMFLAAPSRPAYKPFLVTNVVQPQEDEPGWDCRRHGNRVCGWEITAGDDTKAGA